MVFLIIQIDIKNGLKPIVYNRGKTKKEAIENFVKKYCEIYGYNDEESKNTIIDELTHTNQFQDFEGDAKYFLSPMT